MSLRYFALTVLTALLAFQVLTVVSAQEYGGYTSITNAAVLHGVCGDESKGWLLVVGRDRGGYGVVYNVTNLDSTSPSILLRINPGYYGPRYNLMTLYACSITQHDSNTYLLWLAGAITTGGGQQSRGVLLVYSIPATGGTPTHLGNTSTIEDISALISIRDFIVVRNSTSPNTYHIYALSVVGTAVSLVRINATISVTGTPSATLSPFTMTPLGTGDGYGITYNPIYKRFGALWKSGTDLVISIYEGADTGSPVNIVNVTVVRGFTGIRAAEAAYSKGCVIAAGGKIYRISGEDLSVKVLIENAFNGDAYAMIIAEADGRVGAYLYASYNNIIYIHAYDLVKLGTAYSDALASSATMSGYGDAFIVWADPSTKKINPVGSGNPFMVYTAGSGIIYYDLTRGSSIPYPIPEWGTLIAIALIVPMLALLVKYVRNLDSINSWS